MNNNTKRIIEQLKKGLDITNIQLADALSDIDSDSSGGGGGSAFADYTEGGGTKTKEEFLPAFAESVDNSELFFVLPEGTEFPYTLTEDDKPKLSKAVFIVLTSASDITYVLSKTVGSSGTAYGNYSTQQLVSVTYNETQIQAPGIYKISDQNAVKFTSQSLSDEQKTQARTNIEAEKATIVENLDGSEVEIKVQGGRKYMCGELTSLTISNIEQSTDTSIIYFTSGATPTQFVYPEGTPVSGWDQPEANKIYLICIFNGNLSIEPYE